MPKKEVAIIVPGAKDLSKWPGIVQGICLFMSDIFRFEPVYHDHVKIWKKKMVSRKKKIIWMHWNRGIGALSKMTAKRKLRRLLHHYSSRDLNLVGISIGGDIILETLKKKEYRNINKVVLVCSINEIRELQPRHPQIINVYSKKDNFSHLVISILAPIHGSTRMAGKGVTNIPIRNMTHDGFCKDAKIRSGRYKGKSVTQLVNKLIEN